MLIAIVLIVLLLVILFSALKVASDADDHWETMKDFKEEK